MTTSRQAEEVPFLSGFEHEPKIAEPQQPVAREYTFSIARGLVNIHGMVHSVADVVSALAGKVRSVADRGPDPDYAQSAESLADSGETWIRRRRAVPPNMKRSEWLAMGVACLSVLTTLGAWIWWGGRFSQRMETVENSQKQQGAEIRDIANDNARQNIALGVTGQQYADIIRRLDAIDGKLDRR